MPALRIGANWIFQRLSEITNINFEFEVSEAGTWTEQKNIALVGGECGDIILRDDATDANMAVTDEGPTARRASLSI